MKVSFLFLGTGGSMGVPLVGCSCAVCSSSSPFNKRLRPAGLIRVGEKNYLIDAGPDFRQQALNIKLSRLDGVLLTHAHYDHIGGLDDLRIFFFKQKKKVSCLLSKETLEEIQTRFHYLDKQFEFQLLEGDFGRALFEGLEIEFVSYLQAGMKVNGYRIGNFAYISDIREFSEDIIEKLIGIETLVISALRLEASHVHFSVDEAILFARKVGAKKTYFTHISHDLEHEKTNAMLPKDIKLGFDGLEIPINE